MMVHQLCIWMVLIGTQVAMAEIDQSSLTQVVGSGSTIAAYFMREIIMEYASIQPKTAIQYYPYSSSRGLCRLLDHATKCSISDTADPKSVDFALQEAIPIKNTTLAEFPDVVQFPFSAGAIVPIFNLPAIGTQPFYMKPDILARMFRKCNDGDIGCMPNSIHYWNHSDILALNPHIATELHAAGEIFPIVRDAISGTSLTFKSALALYDPDFASQIPIDEFPNWGVTLVSKAGPEQLVGRVMRTPSTLAFTPLPLVLSAGVQYMTMIPIGGSVADAIRAHDLTVDASIMEAGTMPFVKNVMKLEENQAAASEALDSGIVNVKGKAAWPFSAFTVIGLRMNTKRLDGDCASRVALYNFLKWFYLDSKPREIAMGFGTSLLSIAMSAQIIQIIERDFLCPDVNKPVSQLDESGLVEAYDGSGSIFVPPGTLEQVFVASQTGFKSALGSLSQGKTIAIRPSNNAMNDAFLANSAKPGNVAVIMTNKPDDPAFYSPSFKSEDFIKIPLGNMPGGIIYNLCDPTIPSCPSKSVNLVLDPFLIVAILNGEITTWNHPSIQARNPGAVLPNANIVVLNPIPIYATAFSESLKIITGQDVTYAAAQIPVSSPGQAALTVAGLAYSFAMIPSFDGTLRYAGILNPNSQMVYQANPISLGSCSNGTYSKETGRFSFHYGISGTCYLLSTPVYVVMKREEDCDATNHEVAAVLAAQFISYSLGLSDAQFGLNKENYDEHGHSLTPDDNSTYSISRFAIERSLNHWGLGSYVAPSVDVVSTFEVRTKYQLELEKLSCNEVSILRRHPELGHIPTYIVYCVYAAVGLCLLITMVLSLWIYHNSRKRLIRNSSPAFMGQVLLGSTLALLAIFPMGMQDLEYDFHLPDQDWHHLDMACQAAPFLYSMGFAITFSAMFLKTWRLIKLFNNRKFKKLKITDWILFKYQIIIVGSILLYNIVWILVDPLRYQRVGVAFDDNSGVVVISTGICVMNAEVWIAVGPLFALILAMLVAGNWLSYKSRFIPSEYAESKWVGISMVLYLEAMVLGVPVVILSGTNASASFVVKSAAIILADFGTALLILLPKIWMMYGWDIEGQSSMNRESSSDESSRKQNGKGDSNMGSPGGKPSSSRTKEQEATSHSPTDAPSEIPDDTTDLAKPAKEKRIDPEKSPGFRGAEKLSPRERNLSADIKTSPLTRVLSGNSVRFSPPPMTALSTDSNSASFRKQLEADKRKSQQAANKAGASETDILESKNVQMSTAICEINGVVYKGLIRALNDPMARQYLISVSAPRFFDEPVRLWEDIREFESKKDSHKRLLLAEDIIRRYIVPDAPLEVNLPSSVREKYVRLLLEAEPLLGSNPAPSFWSRLATLFTGKSSNWDRTHTAIVEANSGGLDSEELFKETLEMTPQKAYRCLTKKRLFREIKQHVLREIKDSTQFKEIIRFL